MISWRIRDKKTSDVRRALRVSASGLFAFGSLTSPSCRQPRRCNKGQQAAEYMVLIAALAAAFIAINVYARRGLQGHVKQLVDAEIGRQVDSSPLAVPGTEEGSTDERTSTSGSNTRVRRDGLVARYDFDSSSASSGTSVSTANQEI